MAVKPGYAASCQDREQAGVHPIRVWGKTAGGCGDVRNRGCVFPKTPAAFGARQPFCKAQIRHIYHLRGKQEFTFFFLMYFKIGSHVKF
jgi:hypothetical protein